MIDLTSAPEGATHYMTNGIGDTCWYIIGDGEHKYLYGCDVGKREWRVGDYPMPVYGRIKPIAEQKSERELFVEAALSATKPFSMDVGIVKAVAEDMFDAGFKAPKVGE